MAKQSSTYEASNRASLSKPLPALPDPYFDYLFADAGVEKATGKRDSDGFSVPELAASGYPAAVRKNNSIDNINFNRNSGMSSLPIVFFPMIDFARLVHWRSIFL